MTTRFTTGPLRPRVSWRGIRVMLGGDTLRQGSGVRWRGVRSTASGSRTARRPRHGRRSGDRWL